MRITYWPSERRRRKIHQYLHLCSYQGQLETEVTGVGEAVGLGLGGSRLGSGVVGRVLPVAGQQARDVPGGQTGGRARRLGVEQAPRLKAPAAYVEA